MLATAQTFTLDGIAARPVRVEVDVHRGLPAFAVVGLPDAAVRESRERVRAAIANSGFDFPLTRIVANLAPASLRKAGPGLDLGIAAALLAASGQLASESLARLSFAGELALDGAVRSVPGVLAMTEAARSQGSEAIVVPEANGGEAALVDGIGVLPVSTLAEMVAFVGGDAAPDRPARLGVLCAPAADEPDLADLRGQDILRDSIELAAAGGHSLLMVGPPGAGKSLAARRIPSVMPELGSEEALEVARVASACGRLTDRPPGGRPFRAPHHTISAAGLIGGGNPPRPGEVTLAHHGILFLDELPEFSRDVLEALRTPLEAGTVAIARSGSWRQLPCRFMLVAAANPCPCGRGESHPDCECPPFAVRRYLSRLSGALADRIDIVIGVEQPSAEAMSGGPGESSAAVRERVMAARERQEARLRGGRCNSQMTVAETRDEVPGPEALAVLNETYETMNLSGRGYDRAVRLARTAADLDGSDRIEAAHVHRALGSGRKEVPA